MYGAVELGGTKALVGVGTGVDDLDDVARIPTTTPGETIDRVAEHLARHGGRIEAIGVASFGPIELRKDHPGYGRITNTTKPGWSGAEVAGPLAAALGVPVVLDTDVNGAALGEGRWGAAAGLDDFVYLTVGTGIGGGAVAGGRLIAGLGHPEMGHVVVSPLDGDDFPGICVFHGRCLEGMASGPALAARYGVEPERLADDPAVTWLAAGYLAQGLRDMVYLLAPARVVVGGGVAKLPGMVDAIQARLGDELAGYPGLLEHGDGFVAAAGLGDHAGLAGALILAHGAAR